MQDCFIYMRQLFYGESVKNRVISSSDGLIRCEATCVHEEAAKRILNVRFTKK